MSTTTLSEAQVEVTDAQIDTLWGDAINLCGFDPVACYRWFARSILALREPISGAASDAEDAARLDWMEANWGAFSTDPAPMMFYGMDWGRRQIIYEPNLRAAIDSARKAAGGTTE